MIPQKQQKSQPIIEAPLPEYQLPATTATSAMDSTLPEWLRLADLPGYAVKCGRCGREIWTGYTAEDMLHFCGPCSEAFPR